MKYKKKCNDKISWDYTSNITAFAQKEMVHVFLRGIDSLHQDVQRGYFMTIFDRYTNMLVKKLGEEYENLDKEKLAKQIKSDFNFILSDYEDKMLDFQKKKFIKPIHEMIK